MRLDFNHTIHTPANFFLFGLILATLDRLLAAYATAYFNDVLGQLELNLALFLARKTLIEREATRLTRRSTRLKRILLLHVGAIGEIGAKERLGCGRL